MTRIKVGDKLTIGNSQNKYGHCYSPGDEVTVLKARENEFEVKREVDNFSQAILPEDVLSDDVQRPPMLPAEARLRKDIPLCSGVLDYFPNALAYVAKISKAGNDQHNPGQPLHWDRSKSADHADCVVRHLLERGTIDTDGTRHSGKLAWRALALLEEELEATGAPRGRGSE